MTSEIERFPRLFRAVETVPGLTWPTMTFNGEMTLWLGKLEVEHACSSAAATPRATRSSGCREQNDPVHRRPRRVRRDAATPATPTSRTGRRRSTTLARAQAEALVPGRGAALTAPETVAEGLAGTRGFVSDAVRGGAGRRRGRQGPEARLQGDVRGAEAEVRPLGDLRPLHAVRRDARLRRGDRASPIRASGPPSATTRCGGRWRRPDVSTGPPQLSSAIVHA